MLKKILPGYNYLSIYLLILILFNIFLLYLPLTNVFGYEFSVANSILLVFLSGFYTISLIKKIKLGKINRDLTKKYFRVIIIWFLLIPGFISITHSIFSFSCSFIDGVAFYAVITAPSVVVGIALGFISSYIGKRFQGIIFILILLLIISIPLLEFYLNPQIYFYNPIFGYFPGTIYDEGLSVSLKLLLYRLANLFTSALLYFSFTI